MSGVHIDEDFTVVTYPGGIFGAECREVCVARRMATMSGYPDRVWVQTCSLAEANLMEGTSPGQWVAWVEDNYSRHFVSADREFAAQVVMDDIYGRAESE